MAKELISDGLWAEIEPLLPKPKRRHFRYPGRKPLDKRKALTGIVFVLRSGIPWQMLPPEMGCGSGMSCWRYLSAWHKAGVWQKVHELLLNKLQEANRLNWSRAVVDSASVRALFGGHKSAQTQRIEGNPGVSII